MASPKKRGSLRKNESTKQSRSVGKTSANPRHVACAVFYPNYVRLVLVGSLLSLAFGASILLNLTIIMPFLALAQAYGLIILALSIPAIVSIHRHHLSHYAYVLPSYELAVFCASIIFSGITPLALTVLSAIELGIVIWQLTAKN